MFKMIGRDKGSALVTVIVFMAVLMILGASLLTVSVAEARFAIRQENSTSAHYIARGRRRSIL